MKRLICQLFHRKHFRHLYSYFPWFSIDKFSKLDLYRCVRCNRKFSVEYGAAYRRTQELLAWTEYERTPMKLQKASSAFEELIARIPDDVFIQLTSEELHSMETVLNWLKKESASIRIEKI